MNLLFCKSAMLVMTGLGTHLAPLSELLMAVTIVKLLALLPGEAGT